MNRKQVIMSVLALLALAVLTSVGYSLGSSQVAQTEQTQVAQASMGTAFTYQGRLKESGTVANGNYAFEFSLFDAGVGGSQVGSTITRTAVISEGLFTVKLDFGSVFTGTARYLEIGVRPSGSLGPFTTLTPRQELTPDPYAAHAKSANTLAAPDGDPAEAVTVDNGGRVGIGTTAPQNELTLASGFTFATEMTTPTDVTVTVTSGGFLTSGTYYFRIAASDGVSTTKGSAELVCTVDGITTNRCALSWTAVSGAASYRVYKGTTPLNQDRYQVTTTNSYNYDADVGATLGTVPAVTTAYENKLGAGGNSWLLGGNLGIGTSLPTAGLEVACPPGFTNIKAAGNQLGCMQTGEAGTDSWENAESACFTNYGGRLPTTGEWYIAMANFPLTGETDDWEWNDDLSGANSNYHAVSGGMGAIWQESARLDSDLIDYRCWLPR